ncbi:MAG: acylphosphatase [Planctomycetota bacterium]|nr:acylphosphatase [Planctomycetota bacterium]
MRVCKHVYYLGRVQGVGFRYVVRNLARDAGLVGFVKNLRDGRVELLVEGQDAAVERYLADVAEAMREYIGEVQILDEPPGDQFDAFRIAIDR